ncbi:MAG TPA: DUF5979 domain-containing protein [Acidimicrobiales bacterium]|nr:DUF5979 domain-containing protein [Acidimicrobiales bacterium]
MAERVDDGSGVTVQVTGAGFGRDCTVRVEVTRPDGSVVKGDGSFEPGVDAVTTTSDGTIAYDYRLDGTAGDHRVRVLGADDVELATTILTERADRPPSPPGRGADTGADDSASGPPATEAAPLADDLSGAAGCDAQGGETVATDKADYPPGETVHMAGGGYAPDCTVRIEVTRPDGSIVKGDGTFEPGVDAVTTAVDGTLAYDYQLNGIEGLYRVRVLGADDVELAASTFTDQVLPPRASPSDPRARFVPSNLTRCSELGLQTPPTIQLGRENSNSASDDNVAGTTRPNSGMVVGPAGQGQELNVQILGAGVVVDAVVVKGADGSNVYENPAVLPPALPPPQGYISPRTGGSTIPSISHWFICYHLTEAPPVGSLTVLKQYIAPPGLPAVPLPETFTVTVTCTFEGEEVARQIVTFGPGGGDGEPSPAVEGLAEGTTCTVVEDESDLPAGSVVAYSPADANTDGVVIVGSQGVTMTVTNDFSGVAIQTGGLRIVKIVEPGVALPASLAVDVACDDENETTAVVSLPGTGGEGTPTLELPTGTLCNLQEITGELPEGTVVSYSVDGGPPTTETPVLVGPIVTDEVIEVTITNDPPDPQVPPLPCPEPDPTPPVFAPQPVPPAPCAPTGQLPATGARAVPELLLVAAALVIAGVLARRGSAWGRGSPPR